MHSTPFPGIDVQSDVLHGEALVGASRVIWSALATYTNRFANSIFSANAIASGHRFQVQLALLFFHILRNVFDLLQIGTETGLIGGLGLEYFTGLMLFEEKIARFVFHWFADAILDILRIVFQLCRRQIGVLVEESRRMSLTREMRL